MERTKLNLSLTADAVGVIDANATERKRGEWISNAIMSYAQSLRYNEAGALERIEGKLDRILLIVGEPKAKQQ